MVMKMNTWIARARWVPLVLAMVALTACGDTNADTETDEQEDLCQQAADHHEQCTGEFITPPICDEDALAQAEFVLSVSCEAYDQTFVSDGKADGAFCDWFGTGCTPDEQIFTGPACEEDGQCDAQNFCVEGHCFGGVTSPEFQESLDQFTASQEIEGNNAQLLIHNVATRYLRRDMVQNALESIHFSALLIEDNESGQEFIQDLVDAAGRGVEVRVVVDATSHYFGSSYEMLTTLAEGGVKVISFNPITEWSSLRLMPEYWGLTANMRLHEKILVVDSREAILGGRNVGDSYYDQGRWRDVDIYLSGPGVIAAQEMFLRIWNRIVDWERVAGCASATNYGIYCPPDNKEPVQGSVYYPEFIAAGEARTRVVHSDPYSQETSHGYVTTLSLVRAARESITIANAYFIPPRRLRTHLRAAAERGVEVRVVANSKTSTDSSPVYYAGLNFYKELIRGGVEIYEYNGTETLHSKVMLIDGEVALIGSYNLDPRSAIDNSESMVLVRDSQAVADLQDALQEDIMNSTLATDDIPWTELAKARLHRIAEPLL